MGLLRVIRYGTEFSMRTKRIIFFIIFFIALTGVTLYAVNEITREDRDLLLSQKSVVIEQNDWGIATADEGKAIADKFDAGEAYVIKYITIDSIDMKIFSVNLDEPWANTIARPDDIRVGSYISSSADLGNQTFQALASNDFVNIDNSSTNIYSTYSVNTIQKFVKDSNSFSLEMTGIFEKKAILVDETTKDDAWLLIADETFDELTSFLGIDSTEIYTFHIVVTAPGYSESFASIFFGSSIDKVISNNEIANDNAIGNFGLFLQADLTSIKTQAQSTDLILIIGLIGSPIVATMYAFIISKFRTREIAVLKAVGYSNSSVQAMLLSEIGSVSLIGYVISVIGFQLLLTLNATYELRTTYVPLIWNPFVDLFPSPIAIVTFIFVVLSNILGFIIISRRSIAVRPVELFKNSG